MKNNIILVFDIVIESFWLNADLINETTEKHQPK